MKRNIYNKIRQKGAIDVAIFSATGILFLSIGVAFIYFSLFGNPPINNVKALSQVAGIASSIKYYSADVIIQPEENSNASAAIKGTVSFDVAGGNSTGKFIFPLNPGKVNPTLTIETLSFKDSSFVKFRLDDPNNESLIKYPSGWTSINDSDKGPVQFDILKKSLANSDILELFRKGGEYVLIKGGVEKLLVDTVQTIHFTLRASEAEMSHPKGVSSSFDPIIKNGNVNVWENFKDKSIKEIRFNADGYVVTMKIKDVNKVVSISKPDVALLFTDWKSQQFDEFIPKDTVSEIFIGSYGVIKKEYLEGVRSAVEKATGIKTTTLLPGAALAQNPPLYNATNKQFDSSALFKSAKTASSKYGSRSRFIYVLDADLYSPNENSTTTVWYMDEQGANTAIVSLYGLNKNSDIDPLPAPAPVVVARAQKIALHVLGTSVGFSLSPSADVPSCLMYKATTLAELDKQGTGYCSPENLVIKKFFLK